MIRSGYSFSKADETGNIISAGTGARVLNQIVREKGLNSIEAMEQSRKVDHIINQISKLGKIEEADLTSFQALINER